MLRVVSGALISDGYVLMGLRKASGYRPNLWELPGGKVDEGETPQQALAREWQEECGCNVIVGEFISMAMLQVDISFVIELYEVKLRALSVLPQPLDHQELRWVNPVYAVKHMPCSPAFYLHYQHLLQRIENSWPMSSCDFVGDSGCVNNDCPRCHPKDFLPIKPIAPSMKTPHQLFIEKLEETARREGRPLSEGARQAKLRPINYCELSAAEQWAIDKQLGILDWDGT